MTHQKIALLIIASIQLTFVACSGIEKKEYGFTLIEQELDAFGNAIIVERVSKTIEAESDSSAFLLATRYFAIYLKTYNDVGEIGAQLSSKPIDIKLLNSSGVDISKSVSFILKDSLVSNIMEIELLKPNLLKEVKDNNKEELKIDSSRIKELVGLFDQEKDEFSNENRTWFKPKSAPKYVNRNGIYFYFFTENGVPGNFRFTVQHKADDWLFFEKIQFLIDGKSFDYIPNKTEKDNDEGGIWEWFDEKVTLTDIDLIRALSHANSAKMKLVGSKYYETKTISKKELATMKQTLELFEAMGGEIN